MDAIRAAAWRREQEERRMVTGAWLSANFERTKRLDPLSSIHRRMFGDSRTLEEKAEAARAWARRHNERRKKGAA